ncbi:MAG: GNAT family N-acetyltransferase [Chlorobiota bacterium]|jgi:GNAT superfamily N-acetyltransferase|nr:MAG: GNAT family N-acetyltransferase [Chlorobiota bacterium]
MILIRKTEREDFEVLFNLICSLAEYEKLKVPDDLAKKRLLEDGFGSSPKYISYLVYYDSKPVGYAITFETYSSFLAKPTFYLEDIFVLEQFRNKKIGFSFFSYLIDIAKNNDCGRFEFIVLDWNLNAIKFYEKFGAIHQEEWLNYRITF